MSGISPRALLLAARSHKVAGSVVEFIETTFCDFWRSVLDIEIDRRDFTERAFAAWTRGNVEGITLDEITLTAIIQASAHLVNDYQQTLMLRKLVKAYNQRLINAVADAREVSR